MSQKFCYVVDKNGNPLAPTRKWCFVYKMLRKGKARIVRRKPFTVKLLYLEVPKDKITKCTLCIDPGKTTGIAIIKNDTHEVVFQSESIIEAHKNKEKLERRKLFKQNRKKYQRQKRIRRAKKASTIFNGEKEFYYPKMNKPIKIKYIKPKEPRYLNRKNIRPYSPTVLYFYQMLLRTTKDIMKFLPISNIKIEFTPFDIRKLQDPWVKGFWYQIGRKGRFNSWKDFVLNRDNYQCILCGCKDKLHIHHIIPRHKGGKDRDDNLVTLCKNCHDMIHKLNEKEFNKYVKKFQSYINKFKKRSSYQENLRYASYMNQAIPLLIWKLKKLYPTINIELIDPYDNYQNRVKLGLSKSHINDAISLYGENVKYINDYQFKIIHFFVHNRLATVRIEDRRYMQIVDSNKKGMGKYKTIAKNRKRRNEQDLPSLEELRQKDSKIINKIDKIIKGGPVYKERIPFKSGTIVEIDGKIYIVKCMKFKGTRIVDIYGNEKSIVSKKLNVKVKKYLKLCYM
jgi:hypothetical protein